MVVDEVILNGCMHHKSRGKSERCSNLLITPPTFSLMSSRKKEGKVLFPPSLWPWDKVSDVIIKILVRSVVFSSTGWRGRRVLSE